ncbi:Protein of unknown function DUF1647 family-containing protein [Strongyloides ratti]|uniref:Nucleotide-diphospho-sugar transferase domain-containing protein n=1 Tax=Strongyloides ratti TaxID=34506 RepID=A0A090KZ86_STRRB|nr:Protein of unknown function DUF1647 family-containing protein [Strongyloides ratti]CEF62835.1 Protein of unknown function DUF1647 family-containing protein [Strongyloides ratti]
MYHYEMKKNFDVSLYKYLLELNFLKNNYPDVSKEEKMHPVFLTSMSNKYISRGIGLIKSIQHFFPNSNIIVYDLGITKKNLKHLKRSCNVIYKKFNFKKYPKHVLDLKNYAFKAIVIAETLRDYKAIWYIDSSVSFTRSNLTDVYNAMESKKSSYFLHSKAFHGIVRATASETFNYFPTNIKQIVEKRGLMYQAGLAYILRENETMKKIVKWYLLCSLEKDCIAPRHSKRVCDFLTSNKYGYNIDDCHRFDQSIINIILWNTYEGNTTEYTSGIKNFYLIERKRKDKWNSLKYLLFIILFTKICNTMGIKNIANYTKNLDRIKNELKYSNDMKKTFDISLYKYLKQLKLLEKDYPNVTLKERRNPVFVTQMSDAFVPRGIVMLKSILKYFPKSKIIVYDLGLRKNNIIQLKKVCNVIYKKFNFKNYPKHVSNLKTYAFKAIVIAESLKIYKSIWFIDSSITFTRSNLTDVYKAMELKKSSYLLHDDPGHGILRGTVSGTFDYLSSNTTKLLEEKVTMYQSGLAYIVRNNESMKNVIKWFVLCSLQEDCIAPKYSKKQCNGFKSDRYSYNVDNCHRQDQSIINIILWNAYNQNVTEYTSGYNNFYRVKRGQKGQWKSLLFCKK